MCAGGRRSGILRLTLLAPNILEAIPIDGIRRDCSWTICSGGSRLSGTGGANRGQLAKGLHATYVSRVLRLTLLAPEIVEAILDGRQAAELQPGTSIFH